MVCSALLLLLLLCLAGSLQPPRLLRISQFHLHEVLHTRAGPGGPGLMPGQCYGQRPADVCQGLQLGELCGTTAEHSMHAII
jgi:hypothetical protein